MKFAKDGFQVEAAEAKGRDLPDWFLEEPMVMENETFYLSAYYDLFTCRFYEGGGIPWDKIKDYAENYLELESNHIEVFIEMIYVLDAEYMKESNKTK